MWIMDIYVENWFLVIEGKTKNLWGVFFAKENLIEFYAAIHRSGVLPNWTCIWR